MHIHNNGGRRGASPLQAFQVHIREGDCHISCMQFVNALLAQVHFVHSRWQSMHALNTWNTYAYFKKLDYFSTECRSTDFSRL